MHFEVVRLYSEECLFSWSEEICGPRALSHHPTRLCSGKSLMHSPILRVLTSNPVSLPSGGLPPPPPPSAHLSSLRSPRARSEMSRIVAAACCVYSPLPFLLFQTLHPCCPPAAGLLAWPPATAPTFVRHDREGCWIAPVLVHICLCPCVCVCVWISLQF